MDCECVARKSMQRSDIFITEEIGDRLFSRGSQPGDQAEELTEASDIGARGMISDSSRSLIRAELGHSMRNTGTTRFGVMLEFFVSESVFLL